MAKTQTETKRTMSKKVISAIILMLVALIASTAAVSCSTGSQAPGRPEHVAFHSLEEIPGITVWDITAVDVLREKYSSFSYGALHSTEAFYDRDGEIRGYAALLCEYLTDLFDIPFIPELLEWGQMYPELETDFSGDFIATAQRREELGYYFTDAIAERSFKYFRIAGSAPRSDIIMLRPLRLGFLDGSTTAVAAIASLEASKVPFEPFYFTDNNTIYNELLSGGIDAFINEEVGEAAFLDIGNVVAEEFLPLVIEPVSFTAQNPELEPIINIVQKILDNDGIDYLIDLYEEGYNEYIRHKFYLQLNDREAEYLKQHSDVAYLAEFDNYPVSFYNENEKQWQGIAVDILKKVTNLTGLRFEPVNEPGVSFSELMLKLENGEGSMISELIRNTEREGRFIWPDSYIFQDEFVGISLLTTPDTSVHRIKQLYVGVQKGTAYADLFYAWFPGHTHVIEYADTNECFKGLESGEIDIAMLCMRHLIMATNYNEHPHFKANIVFNYKLGSRFGFNADEEILCSIVDKAMQSINSEELAGAWMRKTFDYRAKIVESQRPWLIGIIASLACLLLLMLYMFYRSRRYARVEEESRFKSMFLATMSHEIRTPMNAIIGIVQIELRKKNLPEEYSAALEKIHIAGNSLLGLINDILDMSKIETGKLELIPAQYDIPSLINDTVQLNVTRAGGKPIEFILDIPDTLPSRLYGDELRLKQILNNLLSNAFKYTEKGYVKLTVGIEPAGRNMPGSSANGDNNSYSADDEVNLVFTVEDTGQGMKPEDKARLFSEYLRFNVEANRTTDGTGLGLAITKRLIDMMNGTIVVESEYGKGTEVRAEVRQKTVECPCIGAETAGRLRSFTFSDSVNRTRISADIEAMPYGKVLVVDDVESNLYVAEGLLTAYELEVDTADSGFMAIEKVKNGMIYDVIFMDHMMPLMDGVETAQKMRAMGYDRAIVALTANALAGNAEMFRKNGFDGFITKPIDALQLDAALKTYVSGKHPEEAGKHTKRVSVDSLNILKTPKLLDAFCRDADKAASSMRKAISSRNPGSVASAAHSMKSALANIGEEELSMRASELEAAGQRGDAEFIIACTESFLQALEELVAGLRALSETGPGYAGTDDTKLVTEQLELIMKACGEYDDETAYAAIGRLRQSQISPETAAAVEKIYDMLYSDSDFEEAAQLAAELIKNNAL